MKMFYAAGARRYQLRVGRPCARSIPLISIASSSGRIDTLPASVASGQRKTPSLQPLRAYPQPGTIKDQRFQSSPRTVCEKKQVPAERVLAELIAHQPE